MPLQSAPQSNFGVKLHHLKFDNQQVAARHLVAHPGGLELRFLGFGAWKTVGVVLGLRFRRMWDTFAVFHLFATLWVILGILQPGRSTVSHTRHTSSDTSSDWRVLALKLLVVPVPKSHHIRFSVNFVRPFLHFGLNNSRHPVLLCVGDDCSRYMAKTR